MSTIYFMNRWFTKNNSIPSSFFISLLSKPKGTFPFYRSQTTQLSHKANSYNMRTTHRTNRAPMIKIRAKFFHFTIFKTKVFLWILQQGNDGVSLNPSCTSPISHTVFLSCLMKNIGSMKKYDPDASTNRGSNPSRIYILTCIWFSFPIVFCSLCIMIFELGKVAKMPSRNCVIRANVQKNRS